MPSVSPQVTYLILSHFKLVTELLCSLLFITRPLSFKIQPATLGKFFHGTLQKFSLAIFLKGTDLSLTYLIFFLS